MKSFMMAVLAALSLCVVGCKCTQPDRVELARQLILSGEAECVLLTKDQMIIERGRGVSPLLNIYDDHRAEMADAHVVDKVIGRATAAMAIAGKVRHVHGELMSEDAVEYLEDYGIRATYTKLVPRILNRTLTDRCPMELAVDGIEDPEAAIEAVRMKLEEFKSNVGA